MKWLEWVEIALGSLMLVAVPLSIILFNDSGHGLFITMRSLVVAIFGVGLLTRGIRGIKDKGLEEHGTTDS